MKLSEIRLLIAGLAVLGITACSEPISEDKIGADILLGIDDRIEIYPYGGEIDIPFHSSGTIYFKTEDDSSGKDIRWLELPDSLSSGASMLHIAAERNEATLRSGKLYAGNTLGGDEVCISIVQDVAKYDFEDIDSLISPAAQTVTIDCESNVNYIVEIVSEDVQILPEYGDNVCFTRNDKQFRFSLPIGLQNQKRKMEISAKSLDLLTDEVIETVDEMTIYQEPYVFTFDKADSDMVYKTVETESVDSDGKEVIFHTSGEWFLNYEEDTKEEHAERWVSVKVNGTELADSVKQTAVGEIKSKMEVKPNLADQRRETYIDFISSGYVIRLTVMQKPVNDAQ